MAKAFRPFLVALLVAGCILLNQSVASAAGCTPLLIELYGPDCGRREGIPVDPNTGGGLGTPEEPALPGTNGGMPSAPAGPTSDGGFELPPELTAQQPFRDDDGDHLNDLNGEDTDNDNDGVPNPSDKYHFPGAARGECVAFFDFDTGEPVPCSAATQMEETADSSGEHPATDGSGDADASDGSDAAVEGADGGSAAETGEGDQQEEDHAQADQKLDAARELFRAAAIQEKKAHNNTQSAWDNERMACMRGNQTDACRQAKAAVKAAEELWSETVFVKHNEFENYRNAYHNRYGVYPPDEHWRMYSGLA